MRALNRILEKLQIFLIEKFSVSVIVLNFQPERLVRCWWNSEISLRCGFLEPRAGEKIRCVPGCPGTTDGNSARLFLHSMARGKKNYKAPLLMSEMDFHRWARKANEIWACVQRALSRSGVLRWIEPSGEIYRRMVRSPLLWFILQKIIDRLTIRFAALLIM